MCGIAGIFERDERVDLGRLRGMADLLRHRGPDDEGIVLIDPGGPWALTLAGRDTPGEVFRSPHRYAPGRWEAARTAPPQPPAPTGAHFRVGLVHRRLSILDLSPAGHQPMCDGDAECWITYNGEIYNFVELRHELEAAGERFTSGSDTEVILGAYRRFGPGCLSRFNGMFAFALWDARRGQLFCARDRFGVKPLYYQWDGRRFAFASEPKALVLTQERSVRADPLAVHDLLALDWVDHQSRTFFEGLWQLPAAHCLTVGQGGFEIRRWWGLSPARRATGTPGEWEREFERLFTDGVALRLRADVEVGSCLSGGIDSSAVVTTASRLSRRPLHAFSCAYDDGPAYDERPHVRTVCEASGAISHLVVPDGRDFWAVFDRLAAAQDEPTAGSGLYSQWKVMELAHHTGLKVLLDGQGGDETLAGYFRYLPIRLRDLLAGFRLGEFARLFGPVTDRLGLPTTLSHMLEPWLPGAMVGALRRRFGQGKDRVLSPALRRLARPALEQRPRPPREFPTSLSRQLAFDTLQRLLPSLLRYEDRNSMAFSIETRLPFLDYRLVEFVFSLPDEQRLDGAVTKAILRRSLRDRIPRPVLERRDKMGFETPADAWLRGRFRGELRRRLLTAGPLHEWVSAAALRVELEDYLAGRRPIGLQIWRWLSLESWARCFIETDPRRSRRLSGGALLDGRDGPGAAGVSAPSPGALAAAVAR
jgi:asparagine synthase (glutamine-hydrolysing)